MQIVVTETNMTKQNPTIFDIWGMGKVINVSDIGDEFATWLNGQTRPIVDVPELTSEPFDWAWYADYERFIKSLLVID